MDTNPYQSPATSSFGDGEGSSIRVEGKSLVAPTERVLPPVCVRTNRAVSEADMVQASLFWCSPWVMFTVLGGPLVIPALFLLGKRFTITYGLIPELRRRYRIWRTVKIALGVLCVCISALTGAAFAAAFAIYPSAEFNFTAAVLVLAILVGFGGSFSVIFIGNPPLIPAKYRQGMFWVNGCSGEYLARIEAGNWSALL